MYPEWYNNLAWKRLRRGGVPPRRQQLHRDVTCRGVIWPPLRRPSPHLIYRGTPGRAAAPAADHPAGVQRAADWGERRYRQGRSRQPGLMMMAFLERKEELKNVLWILTITVILCRRVCYNAEQNIKYRLYLTLWFWWITVRKRK